MLARGVAWRVLAYRLRRLQHVPLACSLICSSHRFCRTTTANAALTCSNTLLPVTTQDKLWRELDLYTHTVPPATSAQRSSLVRWWQTHYSPALFARDTDSSNHTSSSRTSCNVSCLLPSDMDDMLIFMQVLLHNINCLRASPTAAEERVSHEMRAVLMYMAQHRLYSVLTSTLPCEAAEQPPHDVRADVQAACHTLQTRSEEEEEMANVVRRSPHERIRENTLIVSAADLARAEQTIELVCATCTSAQPTRRVKDALYCSVLYLMQLCEQLSAEALASAATCLARCWESYAFVQELPHEECNDNGSVDDDDEMDEPDDVIHAIQRHLRPCTPHSSSDVHACSLSAAEKEEEDEARHAGRAGNALSAITPVSVIGHVHILTMTLCRRMNTVYIDDVAHEQDKGEGNERRKACASECNDEEWQASRDAAQRRLAAARAVLGLCSLQERKRREQQQQQQQQSHSCTTPCDADEWERERVTPPSPRGRRTIAQLIAAKQEQQRNEACSTESQSSTTQTPLPPPSQHNTSITLAEVAEVCTAVASMHYCEAQFWSAVMQFTCRSIAHTAQSAYHSNSAHQQQQQQVQERQDEEDRYMRHVRSILFALDHVGQSAHYDKVIAALLRAGLVQAPVPPPPSRTRHAMRHITPPLSSSSSHV